MKPQRSTIAFKLNPLTASVVLAVGQLASSVALAGSGFGIGTNAGDVMTHAVPTYYANSPAGPVTDLLLNTTAPGSPTIDPASGLPVVVDSGRALRKFVDTLPGFPGLNKSGFLSGPSVNVTTPGTGLGKVIPIATPEKWVSPSGVTTGDDYYEIAAVEFTEKMHSDLPVATRQRGYVQIVTQSMKNAGVVGVDLGFKDAAGNEVFAVAKPTHLGPIILAKSGTAVRVKFTNYLPVGGQLFLPVDTTLTGAGVAKVDAQGNPIYYTQNRAEIHLVGGEAPWISAGSPHQWVAPAGETAAYAAGIGKGPSNQDVPDMAAAGDGSTTLYFPNKLSSRITFFHDRTSGLTRLNTYAGLEAGYLIQDDVVDNPDVTTSLVAQGLLPADQIPLILEDKTFVPANIKQQDAKWAWGGPGELWYPHVYETNQDPTQVNSVNPVGRWDYGPWFWPIFPAAAALPDVSFTPEAYHDTPLVNGVAYPTLTVDPKAYRIRIVNASSDRFFNLGWYLADSATQAPVLDRLGNPTYDQAGNQKFMLNTEVRMVPAVAVDAAGNPATPSVDVNLQLQGALPYEPNCLCQYPNMAQLQAANQFSGPNRAWPIDARVGGAPDPASVGPDFISYGNDGGLLPALVDVPSQPVTYESNRRSVTVSNVYGYGLMVGPSERADTVVDFSGYAGRTLILYNDAPAPMPFNDQRVDYYTGDDDLTASGGTYSTKPGYGPNTRTVMQVVVNPATGTSKPQGFNAAALDTAVSQAYAASQARPIVPQSFYNTAFGTNDPDLFAHVATGSVAQPTLDFSYSGALTITDVQLITSGGAATGPGAANVAGNTIPGSGMGYDPANPPTVVFNDGGCFDPTNPANRRATAIATVDALSRQVTKVALTSAGSGYTCAPVITFDTTVGVGAQATVITSNTNRIPVQTKAEQELFDSLGRYNSTGGIELPFTQANVQTTIPLSYIDAATEYVGDSEVQIWKIVDNGLWSNSMHFDMVDVQLINRVGWDGTVKVPALNEVGWKDTLRLNPLEDVIVAMRAKHPAVPFGLPQSRRSLDPSVAVGQPGSNMGFLVDPNVIVPYTAANGTSGTIAPLSVSVNEVQNFDNEFVWGSAILSHSENDLLRPVVYQASVTAPAKPVLTVQPNGSGTGYVLNWTDGTPADALSTIGNPANETGFFVTRNEVDVTNTVVGTTQFNLPANTVTYTDSTALDGHTYQYTVTVVNAKTSRSSALVVVGLTAPAVPATPTASIAAGGIVTLNWTAVAGATGYQVYVNGTAFGQPVSGTSLTFSGASALALGQNYSLTLSAIRTVTGATATSAQSAARAVSLITNLGVPAPTYNSGTYTLSWPALSAVSPTTAINGYSVIDNGVTKPLAGTSYALTTSGVHTLQVAAVGTVWGGSMTGSYSAVQSVDVPVTPVPTGLVFNGTPALTWTAMPNTTYTLTQSINGAAATPVGLAGPGTSAPLNFGVTGSIYAYNLVASLNGIVSQPATIVRGVAAAVAGTRVTTNSATVNFRLPAAAMGATRFIVTRAAGTSAPIPVVIDVPTGGTAANGWNFRFLNNGLNRRTSYTYTITPVVGSVTLPPTTVTVRTN